MSDSQRHRPGVSLRQSPSAFLTNEHRKAIDFENQLEPSVNLENENDSELRQELCRTLSDLILSDPKFSRDNACCRRLWNTCFYKVVSSYRQKISRAKRKKDTTALNSVNRRYVQFIEEGCALYKYLIDQYLTKLVSKGTQTQESASQDSSIVSVEGISSSLEGVVENLFLLYIHIGDLHRYSEAWSKAETCYLNSVKLAPGKGNPYNQMAVIAQMKESNMSCVALYWYARSLNATHESFEISTGNLDRLFSTNKNYLNEHSRDAKPPIFKLDSTSKTSSEQLRSRKLAANKSCLAHFVDVHNELFKSIDSSNVDEEAVRAKMLDVMASLESLLQVSVFGDSLLCKMVAICAYVYEYGRKKGTTTTLPRELLFMMGTAIGTRLKSLMSNMVRKMIEKDNPAAALRLLLPYQILCEFIGRLEKSEGNAHDLFWKNFSEIANHALEMAKCLGVVPNSYGLGENICVPLKEYQVLQGFVPFKFLYGSYASGEEAFIDTNDAFDALNLASTQSQESVANSARDETKTKLARFLAICKDYAQMDGIPVSFLGDGYSFLAPILQAPELDEPFGGDDFTGYGDNGIDDDDDAGDMIVLGVREEDPSEAAFAVARKNTPPEIHASRNAVNENIAGNDVVNVTKRMETLSPPAALLPPPGFTAPGSPIIDQVRVSPNQMAPQQSLHQGVYGQPLHGQLAGAPPPNEMILPVSVPLQGVPVSGINGNLPFGQPWHVFGAAGTNMQSANPFGGMPPVYGQAKPSNAFFEDQHITTEGTSLLDSALIDSLFTNDSKTNNPWK